MEDNIESNMLFKKFRTLKQYKDYTDEEIKELVIMKLKEKEEKKEEKRDIEDLDIEDMFIDKEERREAKALLKKYLNAYTLDTPSDRNTLKHLIFLEVFNIRLQRELNKYYKEEQPAPNKTVESLHSNLSRISELKDKLGLSREEGKKDENEGYNVLGTLFNKWKIWREENQGSRVLNCPHCGRMILLKIRVKEWEAQKHPFFKDRILANPHLMEMYRLGKITKQDVSLVLGTSIDYVSWLVQKVYYRQFNKVVELNNSENSSEIESGTTVEENGKM